MTISMFSDSFAFEHGLDATTGKPVVVESTVTQSFTDGILNEIKGLFNGGRSASVGASKTVAEIGKIWATKTVDNMRLGDTRIRLNPFSAG